MHGEVLLLALAGAVFLLWFAVILPAQMAGARGRSGLFWVLISLIGSPVLAILLLLVLGDTRRRRG